MKSEKQRAREIELREIEVQAQATYDLIGAGFYPGRQAKPKQKQRKAKMKSENKFTPGPWKVITKGSGNSFWVRVAVDGHHTVAWLDYWTDTDCTSQKAQSEQIANANLIAAAPDLLEALEDTLDLCESYQSGHNSAIAERARVAIAQAKGQP